MENIEQYKDFEDYLKIQNPKVRKNITEVKASELQFPFMLHIDTKPVSAFIPMMPRRAATSEDNTIPRVTVADTLMGCIVGYSAMFYDFMSNDSVEGYIIHKLEFDYCVKPTEKLVYDVEASNEHWLIGYNRNSLKYKTEQIGKFFVSETKFKRLPLKSNGKVSSQAESTLCYLELSEPILIAKDLILEAGYYEVIIEGHEVNYCFDRTDNLKIKKISISEYNKAKNLSAATLSHAEKIKSW